MASASKKRLTRAIIIVIVMMLGLTGVVVILGPGITAFILVLAILGGLEFSARMVTEMVHAENEDTEPKRDRKKFTGLYHL